MPIFEYRCEDCGHRFDAFFRHAEDADKNGLVCAKCGSQKVRKMFSLLGMVNPSRSQESGSCGTRST